MAADNENEPEEPSEFAPSGQPILRHRNQGDFEYAAGDEATIEAVSNHITQHIGPIDFVFHELISDKVHIDVHVVKPRPDRPYITLVTSGMSDRPMTVPPGVEAPQFAELLVCLPPDWPLSQESFEDEANYWPIRWLKQLARLPHDYRTWLGFGHSVPNGDPAEPFADNTDFCCMLVLPPVRFGDDFQLLEMPDGKQIAFYALVPLYAEEMEMKLRRGTNALLEEFDRIGITELIDLDRPNLGE